METEASDQEETRAVTPTIGPEVLKTKLLLLSSKYGWTNNGYPRTTGILQLLSSTLCERQILYMLNHPNLRSESKFDSIFRLKSEYATLRIVDHLKRRLEQEGVKAKFSTEVRSEFGVYDISIVGDSSPQVHEGATPRINIEIKAGLGLPIEQIERYIWESTPLILVRVITNQVILLRPSNLTKLIDFSIENITAKADRLLAGRQLFEVPGLQCEECMDLACRSNKHKRKSQTLVQLDNDDFENDLNRLLGNLPQVAEKTVLLILQEFSHCGQNCASGED